MHTGIDSHRLMHNQIYKDEYDVLVSITDPYSILVAEFLLQRTDADTVTPIYKIFLFQYPTLDKLAIAPVEDIAKLLQPLGLFFRAERLSETAKIIREKYKGKIPQEEAELLKLPGIGNYRASSFEREGCAFARRIPSRVVKANRNQNHHFNLRLNCTRQGSDNNYATSFCIIFSVTQHQTGTGITRLFSTFCEIKL